MEVFAIKHKPTGEYMPARMSRTSSRGWSHWVPGPAPDGWGGCDGYDKNPRVFFTLQSARNALTAWLKGMHNCSRGTTSGTWDSPPESYEVIEIAAPPVERKREDMEIVTLELTGL